MPEERVDIPDRFWIPEMPAEEIRQWEAQLKSGQNSTWPTRFPI
jgi:hypothetical protein